MIRFPIFSRHFQSTVCENRNVSPNKHNCFNISKTSDLRQRILLESGLTFSFNSFSSASFAPVRLGRPKCAFSCRSRLHSDSTCSSCLLRALVCCARSSLQDVLNFKMDLSHKSSIYWLPDRFINFGVLASQRSQVWN